MNRFVIDSTPPEAPSHFLVILHLHQCNDVILYFPNPEEAPSDVPSQWTRTTRWSRSEDFSTRNSKDTSVLTNAISFEAQNLSYIHLGYMVTF